MQPRMTLARTLKLYKLPDQPQTLGLRPLTAQDVPQVGCVPLSVN
jgi:glycylpeptide N-tetradecanoyltransferase